MNAITFKNGFCSLISRLYSRLIAGSFKDYRPSRVHFRR
jgi:hypothetical protein